jgi:SHS2 domain-containing protein
MHEFFEHTADLGLRVRATSLNDLFAEAARALNAAIVDNLDAVRSESEVAVYLPSNDLDYLLFDWLNALLFHNAVDGLVFARFSVQVGPDGLKGKAWGEAMDSDRHELGHEIKAITYHGLKVEETPDGWLAEVIVDI